MNRAPHRRFRLKALNQIIGSWPVLDPDVEPFKFASQAESIGFHVGMFVADGATNIEIEYFEAGNAENQR